MKLIAFKRSNIPSLPKDYITEFIPADFLSSLDGYESLYEDEFNVELAKNEERLRIHLKKMEEEHNNALKANEDAELSNKIKEKELQREFELFKRWKLNKK